MNNTDNNKFRKIEEKWQKKWEDAGIFRVKEDSKKKKFYCLEMFPYPSGSGLHMGHAFNYSVGDAYSRFKRMQGFNVLYPMGYDSFGLPAENAAIKAKSHPKKFTDESIKNFIKQQKSLGLGYDWDRMLKTSDPEYYKWNQYFFLKFYEKGLVYRKTAMVNWCSKCDTVLANEQVHNGKCWRHEDTDVIEKNLEQWFIKTTEYADELLRGIEKLDWPKRIKIMQENWIGKSKGTLVKFKIKNLINNFNKDSDEEIEVFTTRPDTLFGVTFLVYSIQHPKVKELCKGTKQEKEVLKFLNDIPKQDREDKDKQGVFTGRYAVNPLTDEEIPIYASNFVVADYATGVVMAVPAHDFRDFEFAKKYGLNIVRVIAKNSPTKSYLMGATKISDEELNKLGIKIIEKKKDGDRKIEIPEKSLKSYEELISKKLDNSFWNEYIGKEIVFIFKHKNGSVERIVLNKKTEEKIDKLAAEFINDKRWNLPFAKWNKSNVWKWLAENDFYTDLIVHDDSGILVESGEFDGLKSEDAKEKISDALHKKKLGKIITQYKLRDWLVSRQRYWGTPIPMIYCDKCGIIPASYKDLPVKLPDKVTFGEGNPLAASKEFTNVKCPKCKSDARRETDTMDTFFDSSWYFLRYTDNKNSKEPFDKKKAQYWNPVDQYIGGAEHACMHLIYARFFTKVLRDLGYIKFGEPFTKLFNQGMLHGNDGYVMSKSRGNVVLPETVSEKYGIDTARLFLLSVASPEKDTEWNDKGVEGSLRFILRLDDYVNRAKSGKTSNKVKSRLHKAIKEVTENIENFRYNLAIIQIRELFEQFEEEISKEDLGSFLKLLSPFCPHICEEYWEKLGNKDCISISKWPEYDESKIDLVAEALDETLEATKSDIRMVLSIAKIENPKKITLIVSYDWKYEFIEKFKELFETTRNPGEIIKLLISTMPADLKKYGQDITKIVPSLVKDPSKIPKIVLDQKKELDSLKKSSSKLEEEFKAEIEIVSAENSKETKAKIAMPGKPAILVE